MNELAEFHPLLLAGPLVRRWVLILVLAILGGAAGTVSLVLDPARYEGFAVLLLGKSGSSDGGSLFTLASRLGIGGGGSGGDISGIYDEVLRSIAFTDRFAGRTFPIGWKGRTTTLEEQYKLPGAKDTLNHALALNGVFSGKHGLAWKVQPNGTIRLSFQSEDPVLAAAVVLSVLDELQSYTMEMRLQGTMQRLSVTSRNMDSVSRELETAENRVAGFQRSNLGISPDIATRLSRLEREERVLEQVYTTLRQSKATLEIERGTFVPSFQIIESPRPALTPTFKPLKKWIPVGFVLGLFAGIVAAFALGWRKKEFQGLFASFSA